MRSIIVAGAVAGALLAPAAATAAPAKLYVSIGDSYASGFQPTARGEGSNTRNGFAYQVPRFAAKRGQRLRLVNFGCGGATTTSLLDAKGCDRARRGPGGKVYAKQTQADAAAAFLKANRKRVRLVTVSIGGNDVTACAQAADPVPCVATATQSIDANLKTLLTKLRRAAGPKVRIVGITYPNVILGRWLVDDAGKQLAGLSQVAFESFINPTFKKRYEAAGGSFVDVTAATGGNDPLDAPDGTVPKPVATVCDLTFYCEFEDIHARTAGYALIAKLVAAELPKVRARKR